MSSLEVAAKEPEGRSLRLWRVVLSLAEPAGALRDQPSHPGLSENLVFEFDEAYTAFVDRFSTLPSEAQMLALQALDTKVAAMVGAKDADLWTQRARREDPNWDDVRSLATRILVEFGWPTMHA
ncbi:MAG: hypothetical protein GY910_06745 [bacterium]|nr:hypothetical protein [Deltaproteobacteria bacterium]MCP4904661.1 hypothetical protein [bacterium]